MKNSESDAIDNLDPSLELPPLIRQTHFPNIVIFQNYYDQMNQQLKLLQNCGSDEKETRSKVALDSIHKMNNYETTFIFFKIARCEKPDALKSLDRFNQDPDNDSTSLLISCG